MARTFPLYSVLVVTHQLPAKHSDYVDIMNYLSGDTLTALEWPGAKPVLAGWLMEQHPRLRDVPPRPVFGKDDRDTAAMDKWAAAQESVVGARTLSVEPLPPHRRPGAWV